jgi:hypothetical protein
MHGLLGLLVTSLYDGERPFKGGVENLLKGVELWFRKL